MCYLSTLYLTLKAFGGNMGSFFTVASFSLSLNSSLFSARDVVVGYAAWD